MPGASPLPKQGDVFFDRRRPDRSLRISRHPDAGLVVLSIWNGGVCQGTFQLPADQAGMFAEALLHSPPRGVAAETAPELFRTGEYDTQPRIA
ncbi:hypothetical protein [Actinoallomurus acaciae]|uniref:Uncharacterized protein n=1 Tax=Actinoallomurus acaciae TaxID=502577 RepID=A0ABV5YWT4_9ACTN